MVRAPPPVGRKEGSDVQARTQASLSQEERRQPRQAAQRLRKDPVLPTLRRRTPCPPPLASSRRDPAGGRTRTGPREKEPRIRSAGTGLSSWWRSVSGRVLALSGDALHADLGAVLLEADRGQLHLDPLAETGRRRVPTAATADERLELLLDAELAQARGAGLQGLGDPRTARVVGLVVEELEDVGQHVVARVDLDRLAGARSVVAHDWLASSPAPARTNPRSRA